MDVDDIPFVKLKEARDTVFMKLAELEVKMNLYKQKKYKLNKMAQKNILILKENRQVLLREKTRISERLKKGF